MWFKIPLSSPFLLYWLSINHELSLIRALLWFVNLENKFINEQCSSNFYLSNYFFSLSFVPKRKESSNLWVFFFSLFDMLYLWKGNSKCTQSFFFLVSPLRILNMDNSKLFPFFSFSEIILSLFFSSNSDGSGDSDNNNRKRSSRSVNEAH